MSDINQPTGRVSFKRTKEPVRFLNDKDLLELKYVGEQRIQSLSIEGLLSFRGRTTFEFGSLNLLIGPNGTGKSNLLDCIRLLRNSPFDIQETFKDSGFEDWLHKGLDSQSGVGFIEAIVNVLGIRQSIKHEIKLGPQINHRAPLEEAISSSDSKSIEVVRYFTGSYRSEPRIRVSGINQRRAKERVLQRDEYDPFQSILAQIRETDQYPEITGLSKYYENFRLYSEWTFGRNSKLRESASAGSSNVMVSESMDNLALALNFLKNTAAHEKIRELLQELKETYRDYTTRVLFGRIGLAIVEAPFDVSPLPAERLSDGTLRFLALAAILLQSNPPALICLEEPELGMHPDMIRMVAKMIVDASARTQVLVTTHSEYLLSALQDDFDVLFAFDATSKGSIVRRFTQKQYAEWRDEHTLGELWTSGELGGNRW
jgi:predicted ATPase